MRKFITLLFLLSSSLLLADTVELTSKTATEIVLSENPSPTAAFAAKELQNALKATVGTNALIIQENKYVSNPDKVTFFVGKSKFTQAIVDTEKLKYDFFILKRNAKNIYLVGRDDNNNPLANSFSARTGTLYSAYRFMYDVLGTRRLWPGKTGEIIAAKDKIQIPELNINDGPLLPVRNSYYGYGNLYSNESRENLIKWGRFNGMGSSLLGSVTHSESVAIDNKYFDEHPEYYALVDGKRNKLHQYGKTCHSNNDVANIHALWGVGNDTLPDFFSVSANDGRSWCECSNCLKLDGKQKSKNGEICTSGRMFSYANRVAQIVKDSGSDKKVAIYAYADYSEPPDNINKLDEKIIVFVARGISGNSSQTQAEIFKTFFDKWATKTSSIALRDYRNNIIPMLIYPYPKLADFYIKYLVDKFSNFQGIDICGDDTRASALWGPTGYVYAHLLWNPKNNLDSILEDFYTSGWKGGGKFVREYFELFENRAYEVMEKELHESSFYRAGGNDIMVAEKICSPEIMMKGRELLDKAYSSALDDTERKRVDFLRIGWQAVANDLEYYNALTKISAFSGCLLGIAPAADMEGKTLTTSQKIELLEKAIAVSKKRLAFLNKENDCEGIPSAPLSSSKAKFTPEWNRTVEYLYGMYKQGNNNGMTMLEGPWKFNIDPENKGKTLGWHTSSFDDSAWNNIKVGAFWDDQGYGPAEYPKKSGYKGWAWYRKEIKLPEKENFDDIILTLGAVDESYILYVNGVAVKEFFYDRSKNPNSWDEPQNFNIGKYVKWGSSNVIAVAVLSENGKGGIWKPCYYSFVKKNLLESSSLENAAKNIIFSEMEENSYPVSQCILKDKNSLGQVTFSINCKPKTKYIFSIQFKPIGKYLYKLPLSVRFYTNDSESKNVSASGFDSAQLFETNLTINNWHTMEKLFETPPTASKLRINCSVHCTEFFLKDAILSEL